MLDQFSLECSTECQKAKTFIFDPSLIPCYWCGPGRRLGAMSATYQKTRI